MFKLFRRKKNPLPLSFDYPVIRVDYRQFLSLPLAPKEPTIYSIAWNGAIYDILASRISRNRDAVILGSGDFDRAKIKSAPYFARHSWARDLNVNALWYFDPDCREGPATLSWCYGTNADWRLKNIASLLDIFFDRWEIQRKLFFGSSGGGFTSIALACLARSRAFAINPQLICLNFWPGIVGRFRKARLAEGEEPITERLEIAKLIEAENYCPRTTIWQNIKASRDMETQIIPFLERLQTLGLADVPIKIQFFAHPAGHKHMPSREECLESIRRELE